MKTELSTRKQEINKAYNYTKKRVRNIYKQNFNKKWNGRFKKEARKNFIQFFNDTVYNEYMNGNLTEEESFLIVIKTIYNRGINSFMIMLQHDYMN